MSSDAPFVRRGGIETGRERRRQPRWPCWVDVAIMPASTSGGFAAARVQEFSDHGLALSVIERMPPGEQIIVKFAGRGDAPLQLIYTVRNCAPEGVGFRVGAEFAGAIEAPGHEDVDVTRAEFVAWLKASAAAASTD